MSKGAYTMQHPQGNLKKGVLQSPLVRPTVLMEPLQQENAGLKLVPHFLFWFLKCAMLEMLNSVVVQYSYTPNSILLLCIWYTFMVYLKINHLILLIKNSKFITLYAAIFVDT